MKKTKGIKFLEELNRTGLETSNDYLAVRRAYTASLVYEFNTVHKNSIVYLKSCTDGGSFQLHLALYDRFVENRYYDEGSAVAYFSDAVYEEIQKLATGLGIKGKLQWNNTRSTGWISYEEGY